MFVAPALVLLAGILIWPLAKLIALSFEDPQGPLVFYARLVTVPIYVQVLIRTLAFSTGTALICFIAGYPVAYKLANARPVVRGVILICVLLPFWTNLLVRSYGWILVLNPKGIINQLLMGLGVINAPLNLVYNITGILIGMSQIMLPYMILPLYAVMTRLDPRITRAARSLGAGPVATFAKVYFPLTMPGVMSGVLLVFTISLGFFVIPALLGGSHGLMIAQLIEFNINRSLNWGMASALSASLLAVTLSLYWVGDRFLHLGAIWGIKR
ncbi:MAG TPA: ABC transporter permease [Alphaproteobacteria bacterium]|nr:ABC transporter permease [Alphaproteobacteria bacterium]